jgi:hypothetical protein
MPVDLSYDGLFSGLFIEGGLVFAYLTFFVYRLLAASALPRLCRWKRYCLFCIFLFALASLLPAFDHKNFLAESLMLLTLSAPSVILGAVEIIRKCRWHTVLLACVLETLLFPIWVFVVFMVALFFDGAD